MRFISFYTHVPGPNPPTPEEMAAMGKLVEEGMKAGWLIATEGVQSGGRSARVSSSRGKVSVVDGPFAEAKEVIGGYAIMRAGSMEEAIELTRRFLAVVDDDGTCELHQLYEMTGADRPG